MLFYLVDTYNKTSTTAYDEQMLTLTNSQKPAVKVYLYLSCQKNALVSYILVCDMMHRFVLELFVNIVGSHSICRVNS